MWQPDTPDNRFQPGHLINPGPESDAELACRALDGPQRILVQDVRTFEFGQGPNNSKPRTNLARASNAGHRLAHSVKSNSSASL
jgi:hypothetical protein